MVLTRLRAMALAAALTAAGGVGQALAETPATPTPPPATDLFYNYYANGPGAVPAPMYPAPRPTPPMVGHTYITYQPLMPHEFLYQHHRVYTRQHADGSRTRTRVHWGAWPGVPPMFSRLDKPW